MEIDAKCPSGLHILVRGLKGKELNTFANDQGAKRTASMGLRICESCTVKVLDAGPYDLQANGALDWGDVIVGDLTYATLAVREATHAGTREEKFAFKDRCPDPSCDLHKTKFEWEIDPLRELKMKAWTDADRELFRETGGQYTLGLTLSGYSGSSYVKHVEDGHHTIVFRIMRGRDQRKNTKKTDPDRKVTQTLARRIVSIEGPSGAIDKQDWQLWLEELDTSDIETLIDGFDEPDCGLDTTIPMDCPECGEEWRRELPFDRLFKKQAPATRGAGSSSSPS